MSEHKEHFEIHHNELSESTKKSMLSRVVVALVLSCILFPAIFFGGYLFLGVLLIIFGICVGEIISVGESKKEKGISLVSKILIYLTAFVPLLLAYFGNVLFETEETYQLYNLVIGFGSVNISVVSIAFMLLVYVCLVFFDKEFSFKDLIYYFFALILLILGFSAFLNLRFLPLADTLVASNYFTADVALWERCGTSVCLFIYVIIGVLFSDTFAYFFGVLFGKHKMTPNISPKKTWEGFIGGTVFSFVFSFLFGILLACFGYPMLPIFDMDHWYLILIVSLVMPFIAVAGDLLFSIIKRTFEVKDFGTILASHGGFLDRLDSLIVTSIIVVALIEVFNYFL